MGALRQRVIRHAAAIAALVVACSLIVAQSRAYAEVAAACCCGMQKPCKCPEHQPGAPKHHHDQPTMRPCGAPGHAAALPELPVFTAPVLPRVAPPTVTIAIALPLPAPAPAPLDEPAPVPI